MSTRTFFSLALLVTLVITPMQASSDEVVINEWRTCAGTFYETATPRTAHDGHLYYNEFTLHLPSGNSVLAGLFGIHLEEIHDLEGEVYAVGGYGVFRYNQETGELDREIKVSRYSAWIDDYVVWSRDHIVYTAIPDNRSLPFTGLLIWTRGEGWEFVTFDGAARLPVTRVERVRGGLMLYRTPGYIDESSHEPPIFYRWGDKSYTVEALPEVTDK